MLHHMATILVGTGGHSEFKMIAKIKNPTTAILIFTNPPKKLSHTTVDIPIKFHEV
jgi:hypothetical protein